MSNLVSVSIVMSNLVGQNMPVKCRLSSGNCFIRLGPDGLMERRTYNVKTLTEGNQLYCYDPSEARIERETGNRSLGLFDLKLLVDFKKCATLSTPLQYWSLLN